MFFFCIQCRLACRLRDFVVSGQPIDAGHDTDYAPSVGPSSRHGDDTWPDSASPVRPTPTLQETGLVVFRVVGEYTLEHERHPVAQTKTRANDPVDVVDDP